MKIRHLLPAAVLLSMLAALGYLWATGSDYETFVEERGHMHSAPHGGALFSLGDHVGHLEIVADEATGELTAYVLDGEAETPVRLRDAQLAARVRLAPGEPWEPLELRAVENPLSGETVGDTSEFRGALSALKGKQTFEIAFSAFEFRGMMMPEVSGPYPQGNEMAH